MAFRPDTNYHINGKTYYTFYEAISAARQEASGTTVTDDAGNVVFKRSDNADAYHIYQFNNYYGLSANLSYSSSQVISGASADNIGKMRTWLNNYNYSKAINGYGELSNSRAHIFFRHPYISINDVYNAQEVHSGSYYTVRTVSSVFDGNSGKAAKISINLGNVQTNLDKTNAYAFAGMISGSHFYECGLQLRKIGSTYKWYVVSNSNQNGFITLNNNNAIASIGDGGTVEVELVRGNGYIDATVRYNSNQICTMRCTDTNFSDSNYNEFYRTISFCPGDSNSNPTPNLNNGEYFTGVAFGDCYIKRGTATSYADWNYNSSFNKYAVAYNHEFIDAVPSTETVKISYKGRDMSNNLIVS